MFREGSCIVKSFGRCICDLVQVPEVRVCRIDNIAVLAAFMNLLTLRNDILSEPFREHSVKDALFPLSASFFFHARPAKPEETAATDKSPSSYW